MIKGLGDLRAHLRDRREVASGRVPATEAERIRAKQTAQKKAVQLRLTRPLRTSITGRLLKCGTLGQVVAVRGDVLIACFAGSFVYVPVGSDKVEVVK